MDFLLKLLGLFTQKVGGVSTTVKITSTGYNVQADQTAKREKLRELCDQAILDPKFTAETLPSGELETKCNEGTEFILQGMGCRDLDGLMADQMAKKLPQLCQDPNSGWALEDTWSRATGAALKGDIALFIYDNPSGHGHVVVTAPQPMEQSGSWNQLVPVCCSIGTAPNEYRRLSGCFMLSMKPYIKCYIRTSK